MSIIVPLQTNKSLYGRFSDEIQFSKVTLTSTWNLNPTSTERQGMLLFVNPLAVSTQETEKSFVVFRANGIHCRKVDFIRRHRRGLTSCYNSLLYNWYTSALCNLSS